MDLTEKQLNAEYKFEGKIIRVRVDDALLPNGRTSKREVVEHNGGVMVAPMDSDGNLYFVNQFRYPYFEVVTEFPAGKLEKGEDPYKAGIRELKEETGLEISENDAQIEDLGIHNQKKDKDIHLFKVRLPINIEELHCDSMFRDFRDGSKKPEMDGFELLDDSSKFLF